jgi:hypothetical protein
MLILKGVGFASGVASVLGVYYQFVVVPTAAAHEDHMARLRRVDNCLQNALKQQKS